MTTIENKKTTLPGKAEGENADYKFLIEVLLDSKPISGFTRKEFKLIRRIENELEVEKPVIELHHEELLLLQRLNDEIRWKALERDAQKEIEIFTDIIAEAK